MKLIVSENKMKLYNVMRIFSSRCLKTRQFSVVYPETVSPRFNPSLIPGKFRIFNLELVSLKFRFAEPEPDNFSGAAGTILPDPEPEP